MINIKIPFLLLLCNLYIACSPGVMQNLAIGESDASITKDSIWDYTYITYLEEDSANILGEVANIKYDNGVYAILNDKKTIISLFNEEGKCLASLNRMGHARDEYTDILDFDIADGQLYILCNSANNKIITTDLKCRVKQVTDMPYDFTYIAKHEGKLYAYLQYERSLYVYEDSKWKEIIKDGELPALSIPGNPVFFRLKDELLYCSKGGNRIYKISKGKAEELLCFEYPNEEKIMQRLKKRKMLQGKERILFSPPHVFSIVGNGDYYNILYTSQGMFRLCEISKKDLTVSKDGIWLRSPLPNWSSAIGALSNYFITKDDFPLDTLSGTVIVTNKEKLGDGRLSIIRYSDK